MWKEEDKKYAYVFMVRFYIYHIHVGFQPKDFVFEYPNIFYHDEEMQELNKVKDQQEKLTQNSKYVNKYRNGVGQMFGI